jgi:hypothetical protein
MPTCGRCLMALACTRRTVSWWPNPARVGFAAICAGAGMSRWRPCSPARAHCRLLPADDGAVSDPATGRHGPVAVDFHPPGRGLPELAGAAGAACGRSGAVRTGQLATLAATAHTTNPSAELARLRRAALDAGRTARAARRDQERIRRLRGLGFDDLAGYLRHAYATRVSLRSIAKATGLGWPRLRREFDAAGIALESPSPQGCRTSPDKSWSCTTPNTTPPTSKAPTPRWRTATRQEMSSIDQQRGHPSEAFDRNFHHCIGPMRSLHCTSPHASVMPTTVLFPVDRGGLCCPYCWFPRSAAVMAWRRDRLRQSGSRPSSQLPTPLGSSSK